MRNRRFNQSAYKRNIRKALGRTLKAGENTTINDGAFVIYGAHGIIGTLPAGAWEEF